jgi:hypothetical protein
MEAAIEVIGETVVAINRRESCSESEEQAERVRARISAKAGIKVFFTPSF